VRVEKRAMRSRHFNAGFMERPPRCNTGLGLLWSRSRSVVHAVCVSRSYTIHMERTVHILPWPTGLFARGARGRRGRPSNTAAAVVFPYEVHGQASKCPRQPTANPSRHGGFAVLERN
jgi:hypothetical protein